MCDFSDNFNDHTSRDQTLGNAFLASDNDLETLPVLNEIDLPAADPKRDQLEIEDEIGLDASEIVLASRKSGIGAAEANS